MLTRPRFDIKDPRQPVLADRDQPIAFPVELDRADFLRMAPGRSENRSRANIPHAHVKARDGQEFPVRAESQRRDFPFLLSVGEDRPGDRIPDLHLARKETQRDRGSVRAELSRDDAGQLFGPRQSLAVAQDQRVTRNLS